MSLFNYKDVICKEDIMSNLPLTRMDECTHSNHIYRNRFCQDHLVKNLHPDLNTYNEVFKNSVKLFGDNKCLGFRNYNYDLEKSDDSFTSYTYNEVDGMRYALGSGILRVLKNNKFKFSDGHKKITSHDQDWHKFNEENTSFILTLYSNNRYEWMLTDLACVAYSITNTALYDTLGKTSINYILELTESPIIVCSRDKIHTIIDLKRQGMIQEVITIISMDPITEDQFNKCQEVKIELFTFDQVLSIGKQCLTSELPPTSETIYTISFTSGTTSNPKGVVLKHEQAIAANTFLVVNIPSVKDGRAFIFLPLAHIFERETSAFALSAGYYLGFPKLDKSGNTIDDLVEDLKLFQPTYLSLVPRVLNKLESLIKDHLLKLNDHKTNQILKYKQNSYGLFDGNKGKSNYDHYSHYQNIRNMFGFGNTLWINIASAPINPKTVVFLKSALNIGIRQMYGLTETFGAITTTNAYDCRPGSCGFMGICSEFKLASSGELLIRGPVVFPRYYKNPVETAKAIDKDGWFSSGDIVKVGNNGEIYIIDRAKNFFKLSQGEYISPEQLENKYISTNPTINQIMVYGHPTKSYLVGLVGVSNEVDITNTRDAKWKLLQTLNSNVKDINRFERLQNVHIAKEPLKDVLTPTFKLQRAVAISKFKLLFEQLYQEGSLYDSKL